MPTDFLYTIRSQFNSALGDKNETVSAECEESINHYKFYQYCLIPAMVITLAFSTTRKRKNLFLDLLSGRPGLIYPMDSLIRTSRISYACAFGATAFLVYQIVLEQTYAIEFDGNREAQTFVAIGSMVIYGMVFFPLFSSLAIGSVFGYAVGSLYVWMLTGVEIYKLSVCAQTETERVRVVLEGLPSLLCMLYLCVTIPMRVVFAFWKKKIFFWTLDSDESDTLSKIKASYSGLHVGNLFLKKKTKVPPEDRYGRLAAMALKLVHRLIYQRKRGFKYPSRIISVMLVSMLVIYRLTVEMLSLMPLLIDMLYDFGMAVTEELFGIEMEDEDPDKTMLRNVCYFLLYLFSITKVCIIVTNVLATVLALVNVLHSLSSYRVNLLALYKGDHSNIPPASKASNTSHIINCVKYAGFQVAYLIWGYILQFFSMFMVAFILAIVITIFKFGYSNWIIILLKLAWPFVFTLLLLSITQFLLAKFVFLQDRGAYLALNNRRLFFNFTFFMFFYNIFIGLLSCLLRILKAMFIGIVFITRLDSSTLPRRFEFLDPGFQAYVGFMHMEAAHTHPVLIVFTRLMLLGLQTRREREAVRDGLKLVNGVVGPNYVRLQEERAISLSEIDLEVDEGQRRKRMGARFNWHVAYTLLHNPDIRVLRKGYMHILRQARLLGINIPVSDRQSDVNIVELQQNIAEAKRGTNRQGKVDIKDGAACPDDVVVVVTRPEEHRVSRLLLNTRHPQPPATTSAPRTRRGDETATDKARSDSTEKTATDKARSDSTEKTATDKTRSDSTEKTATDKTRSDSTEKTATDKARSDSTEKTATAAGPAPANRTVGLSAKRAAGADLLDSRSLRGTTWESFT